MLRTQNSHRMIRPGIVVTERHLPWVFFLIWPMTEPVMNHVLDPGSCEEVEERHRLEGVAGQQFKADGARVGHEDFRIISGISILQWDVATEARIGTTHGGN